MQPKITHLYYHESVLFELFLHCACSWPENALPPKFFCIVYFRLGDRLTTAVIPVKLQLCQSLSNATFQF